MKKELLVAPVMSRSGYGEMARFAMRSMMSNPDIDLYVHNINWGKTGWIWEDNQERRMIDSLLQKTIMYRQNEGQFDASVQCTIPNEWKRLSPYDVGYTAGIETDKVAPEWLVKGNEVDRIITISKHSKDVYEKTQFEARDQRTGEVIPDYSCETPIEYVGFPTKNVEPTELDLNFKHDFNFVCVVQLGPRKNIDAVINNFIEEFKDDEVGLLLKINGANDSVMDYHNVKKQLDMIKKQLANEEYKCSINLLHGNLTDAQMQGMYQHPKVKAMVSFTHGEGFGLPLYEAAYNGIPVVATDWSGHLDFLTTKTGKRTSKLFVPVKYKLEQIPENCVWDGVLFRESKWANIDDKDAKKKMRDVYKNYTKYKKRAAKLKKTINTDETYWFDKFNKALNLPESDGDTTVIL